MEFTFPTTKSKSKPTKKSNPFYGCFFLQYQEAPFCLPGTCEEHTFLPKPVERIDSKRYKDMYFYSSKASRSGIFKKPEATHWGLYHLPTQTFLFSDVIVHDNQIKVHQHKSTVLTYDGDEYYLKVNFTPKFITYSISEHPSFTKALMAALAVK